MTRNSRRELYGEISKFFVDIAKLVFAGVILAGILKEEINVFWLLVGGLFSISICLSVAYNFFKSSKKL